MTRNARLEATRPITRGQFLKHSLLVLIVGASCLVRPGRNVRTAHSAESPKPPLTEENLNQFLEENWKPIEEAIAKEDFAAFDALFNKAIEAANAFHELRDKWFIKWKLPSQPPPDLDLTPRKK